MKSKKGAVIALLLLATCSEESREANSPTIESARKSLGVVPPSEVATWQRIGSSTVPEGRYLQAMAFDDTRKVVVIFGGLIMNQYMGSITVSQETWEWSTVTGKWTDRTIAGSAPDARSGAAMVFDSTRNKIVLFGGRAGSGYNFEDTWEWDGASGAWTNVTGAGSYPSARSQHAMVFEKSTGKVFLFGGGRSDANSWDGTGITVSLADTWEWDSVTHAWTPVKGRGGSPSARHDFGMVWDTSRNKVVLFGGMQSDISGASGIPKQDTWEFDPAENTWTERTTPGSKPSQRYAHAMAFDGSRGQAVVFGGWDMSTGGSLNDLWDWDPGSGVWTERRTGNEGAMPSPRMYASFVANDASARLELVAGLKPYDPYGTGGTGGIIIKPPYPIYYGTTGSNDVWELEPATATFTDRTAPPDVPSPRTGHAMAYYPPTGHVYLFGGFTMTSQALDDLWEWNGTTWAPVPVTQRPSARGGAGLAYDPVRKSLILFGGTDYFSSYGNADTWEWISTSHAWSQLYPAGSPDPLYSHGMVTDTTRGKILLFGGMSDYYIYNGPDGGIAGAPMKDPMRNEVWEWDGAKLTWTNRTPTAASTAPVARQYPILSYDEGRQKMFLFDGQNYSWNMGGSNSAYWEWDTNSGGWSFHDTGDYLEYSYNNYAVYDSIRRRQVVFTDTSNYTGGPSQTWELDAKGPTWYMRKTNDAPSARSNAAMAFDSARGVVVLFGGSDAMTGYYANDTWEYRVSSWGNGEGCTPAFASSCASGNCVDGVCCDSAACVGPCKSCNVAGSEGTCVLASAGTEVAGSCANGQACDGKGNCLSSNGQPCTSAGICASGFCADGVCCDNACNGTCASCNIAGRAGKCSPYTVGTDPQGECGRGEGLCKSTCDGVGTCVYPSSAMPCASCTVCDGYGKCSVYDPYCSFAGAGGNSGGTGGYTTGRGGSIGGSGGYTTGRGGSTGGTGGSGGYTTGRGGSTGGSGGYTTARGGSTGGSGGYTTARGGSTGGSGGYTTARGGSAGGSGGYTTARGGSGGGGGGTGGNTTSVGGTAGTVTNRGGSGGYAGASGGSGGKADGGNPKDGSMGADAGANSGITNARLHRSGCSCELGSTEQSTGPALLIPFTIAGAVFWRRVRRRRSG